MGMDRIRPDGIESARRLFTEFLADESSRGRPVSFKGAVRTAQALLAGYALHAGASQAEAAPMRLTVNAPMERQAPREMYAPEDIALLAENVYHEAKGETAHGQLGVVQVTLARLSDGRFGKTLREVILAKNQFSWTREASASVSPADAKAVDELRVILWSFTRGKPPKRAVEELSKITGIPARALFYKRTDWDETKPSETRMSAKTKDMFKKLEQVGTVDKHTFYAERPAR